MKIFYKTFVFRHGTAVHPLGDALALAAAFVWAVYSILTRKISSLGYPVILCTRRTFFYGLLWMIPALFFFDFQLGISRLLSEYKPKRL